MTAPRPLPGPATCVDCAVDGTLHCPIHGEASDYGRLGSCLGVLLMVAAACIVVAAAVLLVIAWRTR